MKEPKIGQKGDAKLLGKRSPTNKDLLKNVGAGDAGKSDKKKEDSDQN